MEYIWLPMSENNLTVSLTVGISFKYWPYISIRTKLYYIYSAINPFKQPKRAFKLWSGYLPVTGRVLLYRLFVRYGTKLASTRDERSEDRFRVRVGLDTSFMAIYINITVYTGEDHRNNRSDVFTRGPTLL